MKPILLDLPMPIVTPRLILKPPKVGDGLMVNKAVLESFNELHQYIPITPQDAIFKSQLTSNLKRSSIAKARNRPTIPALLLNQIVSTSRNLSLKISHLEM